MTPATGGTDDRTDRVDARDGRGSRDGADCTGRLAGADAALVVSLQTRPRSWLAARDACPAVAFVATYPHPDCYRTVSDPGDAVGIALAIDEWHRSLSDDATPAVCLADVDTLVEYAGATAARRFLHVVAGRVRAAGGTVHCHDDADAAATAPPDHYLRPPTGSDDSTASTRTPGRQQ